MLRTLALLVASAATACDHEVSATPVVAREHRFGIFRDLVLYERPLADGGPFFLDRFESTVADFGSWRGVARGKGFEKDLRPQDRIDLYEARRFARWRFCRIPRADEWLYATTQGGTYNFPWGDSFVDTQANTGRLGLPDTLRVGSFASGGGRPDGPFDLVGNVAEWTETVADADTGLPIPYTHSVTVPVDVERVVGLPEWPDFQPPEPNGRPWEQAGAMPLGLRVWLPLWAPLPAAWLQRGGFAFRERYSAWRRTETLDMPGIDALRRAPGLRCWLPAGCPAPTDWLVFAETDELRRAVLGGHRTSRIVDDDKLPPPLYWEPGTRGPSTGVRVAADPGGLLEALLRFAGEMPGEPALATLRRFLRDDSNRRVLRRAWPMVLRSHVRSGVLRPVLVAELGGE